MAFCSDDPNVLSNPKVRMHRNDAHRRSSYHPDMVRKRLPTTSVGPDWFLVEWMQSKNMKQAELARRTGWSKATTNDIVNGRTSYYRQILNEAAAALHVQPWELLMSPADANALRGMREDAIRIAGGTVTAWTPASLEDERKTGTG
ncbi:hypothetical protein NSDW_33200 [Novosphingobium olei]|nr:hypothetical protein NSDW_33200 [Novosphingobium olei]